MGNRHHSHELPTGTTAGTLFQTHRKPTVDTIACVHGHING
ncbi:hypothetical protein [Haloquadratum walsbyi]|nr:hypothetical protein [Haloquadratum walsbyi]